eukprot:11027735-Alexandrium_andersonii.AAC.1
MQGGCHESQPAVSPGGCHWVRAAAFPAETAYPMTRAGSDPPPWRLLECSRGCGGCSAAGCSGERAVVHGAVP